jgi:hypothetical protein
MKKSDLENSLEIFCEGSFENKSLKRMFYRLGKIYYNEKFQENMKRGVALDKVEDDSLVDTITYLFKVRDYYDDWNKTTIFVNNYLIESN